MPVSTESIWREFSAQLHAYLRRRVHDQTAADDILQEVFLKVHTRLHTLRDTRRLAPWLYAITRNALADHFRQAPVSALPEDVAAEHETGDGEAQRQTAASLLSLVKCLPESYRRAVELFELEGLKQEEIGKLLGLSLSGAKSRIQRGRRMLKDALLDCCHYEFDRLGHVIASGERRACCRRHNLCNN